MTATGRPSVVFVSSHAELGGSEVYLERLLHRLAPESVRAVVVLGDGPLVGRLRAAGHPVAVAPTGRRLGILRSAVTLRRYLRRRTPETVVHANGVKAALVAALATLGTRRPPVVWVKHDFSWDGPLGRLVALGCGRVVGVSAAVVEPVAQVPSVSVRVVPNGIPAPAVDRDRARADVRALTGASGPVVVLVGRLDPVKAQHELVEAAPAILSAVPDAAVLLVGGEDPAHPGYATRLRRRIGELGLDGRITLAGHRDDAVSLVAGSDVVVVPTLRDPRTGRGREGFGFVGVEAMAVGTPVVGYADGALPEVLGPCARLVPPGDRAALARAVADLLEQPAERAALAACGRARVADRFGIDAMVDAMGDVYAAARPLPARGAHAAGRRSAPH